VKESPKLLKIIVTMALVFLVVGAGAWAFISHQRAEAAQFEATAEPSSGTVTEKWQGFAETEWRPMQNRYVLAYKFKTASGAIVDGSDTVDPAMWNRFRRGDDIRVYYLPNAPQVNHLRLQSAAIKGLNWSPFVLVLVVGCLFAVVFILLWRRV
jgi:hypothetical protein